MPFFLSVILVLLSLLAVVAGVLRLLILRGGRGVPDIDPETLGQPGQSAIEVARQPGGYLQITWKGKGPAKIFAGAEPDGIDFSRPVATAANAAAITVQAPEDRRQYFALRLAGNDQPQIVAERHLPLHKGVNIRDIGGYQTLDGATVRWGQVYRSGDLSRLTAADLAYLENLGVRWVCDLRSRRELAERPDRLPAGAGYLHLPINEGHSPMRNYFYKVLFQRHRLGELMAGIYMSMAADQALLLGQWLAPLADPAKLPAIVHCTAGKDRTGFAVALLLGLLRVPRETIISDYLVSNAAFDRLYAGFKAGTRHLGRLGVPFEQLRMLLIADPDWLIASLDYVDAEFGSVEAYVIRACGLSPAEVAAIRQNLLA